MPMKYELAAIKGCWIFSIWVKVEGVPVPVHDIINAKEGPEAWIAVEEDREYTVHYSIRRLPEKGDQWVLEEYPDFEVSCVADGDLMDVNLNRFNEVHAGVAGGNFEGRQLPKKKMRRLIFARPPLSKKQTKANLDRMGTIEVAFQRCDASHGEAFVNKEKLPNKTLNEREASDNHIDMVTSFGPVVPSTKVPTNITGTIAPPDSDDFVSMQLRYVTKDTLMALGHMKEEEPAPSPPIQHSQPKSKRAAAPSSRAKERQVATPKKVVAPAREMSVEAAPPVIAEAPQLVQEVLSTIGAIATMNKTLMDKLSRLHKAKAAEIALGYVEISNISSAIGCMKPSLQTKLRTLEAASNKESMARYGPATGEVKEMAEAIFTMNKALQEKVKELQNGPTSGNAAGLEELQAMSNTLRVMIGSMQERLESVEDEEQDCSHRHSPDAVQDDDRSARRSTAKRRKIA